MEKKKKKKKRNRCVGYKQGQLVGFRVIVHSSKSSAVHVAIMRAGKPDLLSLITRDDSRTRHCEHKATDLLATDHGLHITNRP